MGNSEISLLSKYRTQLMGLAMLLIFHTGINVKSVNVIRSIKDIGDMGVDIFLLLSGIGLYFCYYQFNNQFTNCKSKYYVYIPLSLSICLLATKLLDKFSDGKFKILTFLGIYSLEIYLFHEKILWILSFSERIKVIDKYHIVLNIIAYLVAMVVAYLWSNIVSKTISRKQTITGQIDFQSFLIRIQFAI